MRGNKEEIDRNLLMSPHTYVYFLLQQQDCIYFSVILHQSHGHSAMHHKDLPSIYFDSGLNMSKIINVLYQQKLKQTKLFLVLRDMPLKYKEERTMQAIELLKRSLNIFFK